MVDKNKALHQKQCMDMNTIKSVKKRCVVCGKEFMTIKSARNRAKYCSHKCKYLGGKKIRKDRIENAMLNEDLDTRLHANHSHIYGLKENKNIDVLMYRIIKKGVELI